MNTDQARVFLSRVVPWLPDTYVNIHWTRQAEGYDRPFWAGRACSTIDQMLSTLKWVESLKDTRDIYACLSAQAVAIERVAKASGRTYLEAERKRQNAVGLKALYMDIDVGKGNGYDTMQAAVNALGGFTKLVGLPMPSIIVQSGSGGMHVYWVLDRVLPPEEWQKHANALANAAKTHGFKCDTQVTVDAARILRVPGTMNRRVNKPVVLKELVNYDYDVEVIGSILEPFQAEPDIPSNVVPLFRNTEPVDPEFAQDIANAGGEEKFADPVDLDLVAEKCGFIKEAIDTGGAAFQQPLWHLSVLAATFSMGERADAHRMSQGHPEYTQEATDEMYDRKIKERQERDIGWPSCNAVANAGCGSCVTCPLRGKIKSPLSQGKNAPPQATVANADMPDRYLRDTRGIVSVRQFDKKAQTMEVTQVAPFPFKDPWVQANPWALHFTTSTVHGRGLVDMSIPYSQIATVEGFRGWMSENGFLLGDTQTKLTKEFLVAWTQQLQNMKDRVVNFSPFGWMDGDDGVVHGFTYGGFSFTDAGKKPAALPYGPTGTHYKPKGSLDKWKHAMEAITGVGPEHDAILAHGFGAPMLRLLGQEGMLFSVYSPESGAGKTTAISIAQAIWGYPKATGGLKDTAKSTADHMGILKHLPVYWDEIKEEDQVKAFLSLLFVLSGGRSHRRLTSSSKQMEVGEWQTIMLSASNETLLDRIERQTKNTTAGVYRAIEFEVPKKPRRLSYSDVQTRVNDLKLNFGHAGLIYAEFLGENASRIEAEVRERHESFIAQHSADEAERFWTTGIVSLLQGARYANQLELANIDEPALEEFLVSVLNKMREYVGGTTNDVKQLSSVTSIFQDFLDDMFAGHTIVTDKFWHGRGRPSGIVVKNDPKGFKSCQVHISLADDKIRINIATLRDWLIEKHYSPTVIMDEIKKQFRTTAVNTVMAAGTWAAAKINTRMIEIDLKNAAAINLTLEGNSDPTSTDDPAGVPNAQPGDTLQ
jgi:hypothetical protein